MEISCSSLVKAFIVGVRIRRYEDSFETWSIVTPGRGVPPVYAHIRLWMKSGEVLSKLVS